MPSFVFTGLVETVYPETRDAAGIPVGAVEPGDARDLDSAPDWQWLPAADAPPAAVSDPEPADEAPAPGQPEAPAPAPVPPAVVPPAGTAFAVTTGQ